jgi:uncharacterized protein YcaQ
MLEFLWIQGVIVPAGRRRGQRVWELMQRWLPDELATARPSGEMATRRAVERSLRSLGIATERQIDGNFTRYRYPDLADVLRGSAAQGRILSVRILATADGPAWPGAWWLHADDLPLLEAIRAAGDTWAGRTTLLSALDNLIADRQRAERLFELRFRQLPFVPLRKRAESTSVLPILDGDRILGRVQARHTRSERSLVIASLQLEVNVPRTAAVAARVRGALDELAGFLGAREVRVEAAVPDRWRRTMAG